MDEVTADYGIRYRQCARLCLAEYRRKDTTGLGDACMKLANCTK